MVRPSRKEVGSFRTMKTTMDQGEANEDQSDTKEDHGEDHSGT